MGRVFFFIAEAFRALRRSAAPSLAAIVTVVLTTLLLGVFIPVIRASSTTNENVRSQLALRGLPDVGCQQEAGASRAAEDRRDPARRAHRVRLEGRGPEGPAQGGRERSAQRGDHPAAGTTRCPLDQRLSGRPGQPRLDPGGDHAARAPTASRSRSARRSTTSATAQRRRRRDSHRDQRREDHPPRDRGPAPGRIADAGREHDPALDLRAAPRDRGDEAGRRDQLVHPLALRARGADRRPRLAPGSLSGSSGSGR